MKDTSKVIRLPKCKILKPYICTYFFITETSVWADVLNMDDKVNVDYPKLEEWFAQKQSPSVSLKPENNKSPLARKHSTPQEVCYKTEQ